MSNDAWLPIAAFSGTIFIVATAAGLLLAWAQERFTGKESEGK